MADPSSQCEKKISQQKTYQELFQLRLQAKLAAEQSRDGYTLHRDEGIFKAIKAIKQQIPISASVLASLLLNYVWNTRLLCFESSKFQREILTHLLLIYD